MTGSPKSSSGGPHGAREVVAALLEAGADPNARGDHSAFPLLIAARYGTGEVVAALLEAGADLEVRDEDGSTALHGAAGGGAVEAVMTLLEVGVDLEARNLDGSTPLHSAAKGGTAEVVMPLLAAGASPGARDNDGKQPFEYARDNEELQGTERMNRTLLDECFRVKGRPTWYTSAEEIQRDLDQYLAFYNLKRSHQDYRLKGHTPAQALREALGRKKLPTAVPIAEKEVP